MFETRLEAVAEAVHDSVTGDALFREAVKNAQLGDAALERYVRMMTPEQRDQVMEQLHELYGKIGAALA